MGTHPNINFDRFPRQGDHAGKRVKVCFGYDASRTLPGVCIRDDLEAPFDTILLLDDGRAIRATECQYAISDD